MFPSCDIATSAELRFTGFHIAEQYRSDRPFNLRDSEIVFEDIGFEIRILHFDESLNNPAFRMGYGVKVGIWIHFQLD
jgi:hypothetical protein